MEPDILERLRNCLEKRELPTWSDISDAIDEIEGQRLLAAALGSAVQNDDSL